MLAFYFGWRVCFFSSPVICSISFQVAPLVYNCVLFFLVVVDQNILDTSSLHRGDSFRVWRMFELRTGPSPFCCSQNVCWFFRCCFLFLFDWKERNSFFYTVIFNQGIFMTLLFTMRTCWEEPILFVTYPLKGLGILWHLYRPFEKMKKIHSEDLLEAFALFIVVRSFWFLRLHV